MMKAIDIALKDMTQSFRSLFALAFMFLVPILLTGMFYLMFGGGDQDEEASFVLPVTQVVIANLDQGEFQAGAQPGTPHSLGELIIQILSSTEFEQIMAVTLVPDAPSALAAVDNQQAGLALILPDNFSDAINSPNSSAQVSYYQDPTLTVGPEVVRGIVDQILDQISGSKITLQITLQQFQESGVQVDQPLVQTLLSSYLAANPSGLDNPDSQAPAALQLFAQDEASPLANPAANLVGMMLTGMTVFYVFFTGASSAQTILREEERGTLPRLFSTPTPRTSIFAGKFMASALTILVQIVVLLFFGRYVFGIRWGQAGSVALVAAGMILAASSFGIFLIAWVKTERQAGAITGSLVTIMGMLGMLPIFVMGNPAPPAFIATAARFVPQGWAVQGLQAAMNGGTPSEMLPYLLALLLWGVLFFSIGTFKFRNRYA